jgi:hypothetical protein
MTATGLLLVVLSSGGHWFGGETGTVLLQWVAESAQHDALLVWELKHGGVQLAHNQLELKHSSKPTTIRITPPPVSARTTMRWKYRVVAESGDEEIACGERTIDVYPDNLLKDLDKRVAGKTVTVLDRSGQLPKLLTEVDVPHRTIEQPSNIELKSSDIIIIGADQIEDKPLVRRPWLAQARAGASVLILKQTRTKALAGYKLGSRFSALTVHWREKHPLLHGFETDDLKSLLDTSGRGLTPVQLPADEPALEVGFWSKETTSKTPVPIDALLAIKSVGKGRLILCQIDLGPWDTDPRSQRFLANAVAYMTTRPEPTPRPSERTTERIVELQSVPTITIPAGDTR